MDVRLLIHDVLVSLAEHHKRGKVHAGAAAFRRLERRLNCPHRAHLWFGVHVCVGVTAGAPALRPQALHLNTRDRAGHFEVVVSPTHGGHSGISRGTGAATELPMSCSEMCGVGAPPRHAMRGSQAWSTYTPPEVAILLSGVEGHFDGRQAGGVDDHTPSAGQHLAAPAMLMAAGGLDGRAGDMWGVGCLLAEAVRGTPLFRRQGFLVQVRVDREGSCRVLCVLTAQPPLSQLLHTMGKPSVLDVPYLSRLPSAARDGPLASVLSLLLGDGLGSKLAIASSDDVRRRCLQRHLPLLSLHGVSFLAECLAWNPARRMTVHQALEHPWLAGVGSGDEIHGTVVGLLGLAPAPGQQLARPVSVPVPEREPSGPAPEGDGTVRRGGAADELQELIRKYTQEDDRTRGKQGPTVTNRGNIEPPQHAPLDGSEGGSFAPPLWSSTSDRQGARKSSDLLQQVADLAHDSAVKGWAEAVPDTDVDGNSLTGRQRRQLWMDRQHGRWTPQGPPRRSPRHRVHRGASTKARVAKPDAVTRACDCACGGRGSCSCRHRAGRCTRCVASRRWIRIAQDSLGPYEAQRARRANRMHDGRPAASVTSSSIGEPHPRRACRCGGRVTQRAERSKRARARRRTADSMGHEPYHDEGCEFEPHVPPPKPTWKESGRPAEHPRPWGAPKSRPHTAPPPHLLYGTTAWKASRGSTSPRRRRDPARARRRSGRARGRSTSPRPRRAGSASPPADKSGAPATSSALAHNEGDRARATSVPARRGRRRAGGSRRSSLGEVSPWGTEPLNRDDPDAIDFVALARNDRDAPHGDSLPPASFCPSEPFVARYSPGRKSKRTARARGRFKPPARASPRRQRRRKPAARARPRGRVKGRKSRGAAASRPSPRARLQRVNEALEVAFKPPPPPPLPVAHALQPSRRRGVAPPAVPTRRVAAAAVQDTRSGSVAGTFVPSPTGSLAGVATAAAAAATTAAAASPASPAQEDNEPTMQHVMEVLAQATPSRRRTASHGGASPTPDANDVRRQVEEAHDGSVETERVPHTAVAGGGASVRAQAPKPVRAGSLQVASDAHPDSHVKVNRNAGPVDATDVSTILRIACRTVELFPSVYADALARVPGTTGRQLRAAQECGPPSVRARVCVMERQAVANQFSATPARSQHMKQLCSTAAAVGVKTEPPQAPSVGLEHGVTAPPVQVRRQMPRVQYQLHDVASVPVGRRRLEEWCGEDTPFVFQVRA